MRSGVSFPSVASLATWSAVTRTNLLLQSSTFDNATWSKINGGSGSAPVVTANNVAAPDGTMTADKVVFTRGAGTADGDFSLLSQGSLAVTVARTYTGSLWIRADVATNIAYRQVGAAGYTAFAVTTAWQRFSTTEVAAAGSISFGLRSTYQGVNATATVYIWRGQVEAGPIATAGIETTTVAASDTSALNASYPLTNLPNLYKIRTPAQWATAAGAYASFLLSATKSVQFLALAHHNAPAGATFRIILFSDTNPDPILNQAHVVHDSGVQIFVAPVSPYPQVQPYRLSAAVTARSGWLELSDRRVTDAVVWSLGAVEISGFWEWQDVEVPREFGFANTDVVAQQPFNVDHVMTQFAPRTWVGTRGLVDQSENNTTAVDFQLEKKTHQPFVFCWDTDDTATYAREAILVRNSRITPPTQNDYPGGSQSFGLIEHLAA